MLNRTVSYKALLRVIGGCFLLYGSYIIVLVLTSQISDIGSINYNGPLIFEDPNVVRNYIFCGGLFPGNPLLPLPVPLGGFLTFAPFTPGPFLWVSLGILCLGITSRHANAVYICLQIALWFISLSVWFPIFFLLRLTNYDPGSFVPFMLVTLAFSLILLATYKPVIRFLRILGGSDRATPIIRA
jgi:hypothetical protein